MVNLFELGARPTPSITKVFVLRSAAHPAAQRLRHLLQHPLHAARRAARLRVQRHMRLAMLWELCSESCAIGFAFAVIPATRK